MKQSFAWWSFARGQYAPQQLLRAAADIGYQGVELIERELWPLAKDCGLSIASTNGGLSIERGLNRREHHAHIEEQLRATIAEAEQWNIPNVIVFSGNRDGLDDQAGCE